MICTTCNLQYPDYLNFCRRCGRALVRSMTETVVESQCCTRCGARVVHGENFCQQCGNRLNVRTQETVIGACHHCGTSWRSSWLFCKNCGLDRDHALMQRVSAPVVTGGSRSEASAQIEELINVEKVFCPKCGIESKPYSKFCEACGLTLAHESGLDAGEFEIGGLPERDVSNEATLLEMEVTEPVVKTKAPSTSPEMPAPLTDRSSINRPTEVIEYSGDTSELAEDLNLVEDGFGDDTAGYSRIYEGDSSTQTEIRKRNTRAAVQTMGLLAVLFFVMIAVYLWWISQSKKPGENEGSSQVSRQVETGQNQQGSGSGPAPETATPTAPGGMVYIKGGQFIMGRDDGDEFERPAYTVTIGPFFIDITEVTQEEYQIFVTATGHRTPPHWKDGKYPDGQMKYPVVNVSWEDAAAYARWANKRLPTEEEWELAAKGTSDRRYPWGGSWNANFANAAKGSSGSIMEVGIFKEGASPFGMLDMSGNVWEWTASDLTSYTNKNIKLAEGKVIRGGAYDVPANRATTTYRGVVPPDKYYDKTGFRCVRDVE